MGGISHYSNAYRKLKADEKMSPSQVRDSIADMLGLELEELHSQLGDTGNETDDGMETRESFIQLQGYTIHTSDLRRILRAHLRKENVDLNSSSGREMWET